jgi:hypothetical protein
MKPVLNCTQCDAFNFHTAPSVLISIQTEVGMCTHEDRPTEITLRGLIRLKCTMSGTKKKNCREAEKILQRMAAGVPLIYSTL